MHTTFRLAAALLALPVAAVSLGAQSTLQRTADFRDYSASETEEYQATFGVPVVSGGLNFYQNQAGSTGGAARNVLATWGTDEDFGGTTDVPPGSSTFMFGTLANSRFDVYGVSSFPVFNLLSIDIAPLYARSTLGTTTFGGFTLNFFGWTEGNFGTNNRSQSFAIPLLTGLDRPEPFTLTFNSTFTGLQQVVWFQGANDAQSHQFSNVVTEVVIPEPATVVLMASGLAALGLASRRRFNRAA